MKDLSLRLRARAEALRMSNAELARRAGLSDQRLGNYLSGIREPDLATLMRLAAALHTSPNELLAFEGDAEQGNARAEMSERAHRAIDLVDLRDLEVVTRMIEAAILQR